MPPQYKVCIVNKSAQSRYPIPILWASFKTYFEENSIHKDQWNWIPPALEINDQIVEDIINENPKIIGLSVYIWNENFSHDLAKLFKQRLPNTIIVIGGPQCDIKYNADFFKQYPYIDLVIPGDAYGELSMLGILDNISENNGSLNPATLSYAYYPDQNLNVKFNELAPKKKEFNWFANPYRAQESVLKPMLPEFAKKTGTIWLTLETSRGCPYKCSFCDWGGGTYTKTVKKPFSTVLDEITWAGENKIDAVYFTDANFGMFDIDIEYAKHIVNVSKKYGYPKQVAIQPTKVKLNNLYKIYELLAGADLLSHYQISIQDLDDDVKKNIDRIDFSFEEQVAMFKQLQEVKYLPVYIECILGLPGSSIATIKTAIQRISLEKLPFPIAHHWVLLPATPAYDPKFREQFKLVTIKGKSSTGLGLITFIKEKLNRSVDVGVNAGKDDASDMATEYVVGSFSYTPSEWVEMNLLQIFVASMQQTEILSLIADYLWQEHQINYGDFFHTCLNTLLYDAQVDPVFRSELSKLQQTLEEWLSGSRNDVYIDYDEDFTFELAPAIYYMFVVLTHIDEFFSAVELAIAKLIAVDDKIVDLCRYSKDRLIDITYRPNKIVSSNYDWSKYISSGILDYNPKTYKLTDTKILVGGKWFDIDWEQYQGTKNYYTHYIYRVCFDIRGSKVVKNIKEVI